MYPKYGGGRVNMLLKVPFSENYYEKHYFLVIFSCR